MGNWASGGIVLRILIALLCGVAATWLALWYLIPAPPSTIVIAAGFKDGPFEYIARRYRERLAQHHVKLEIRLAPGALGDLRLIEGRNSDVDAAFLYGGVTDITKSPNLVSLGRIAFDPMWFFYSGPESLDRISQFKGKRLGANPAFPPIQRILKKSGVDPDSAKYLARIGPASVKALKDGEVDAIILLAEFNAPFIQSLLRDPTVRLMNMTQADAFTRILPYLNRLVLPQGIVDPENNIPANDVNLIATTTSVVVRKTLNPELIYLLARTMQEEHSGVGIFQRAGQFPTQTDPEFPMAEEALDFYKNGPSFLHRYLPFWMVSYAKRVAAILVTVIAIVIPIFSYAPRVYQWFLRGYLKKLYRRLRTIEAELRTEFTAPQAERLQADLENINRAANILPTRHSDAFFELIIHIRDTRAELASRLAALRS